MGNCFYSLSIFYQIYMAKNDGHQNIIAICYRSTCPSKNLLTQKPPVLPTQHCNIHTEVVHQFISIIRIENEKMFTVLSHLETVENKDCAGFGPDGP